MRVEEIFPGAAVCGRIVSPEGRPVAGSVSIQLSKQSFEAQAGEDGRFELRDLPILEIAQGYGKLGNGGLVVQSEGFAPAIVSLPVLPSGGQIDLGDIAVHPGTRFKGSVLSVDGEPAPNLPIEISVWTHDLGNTIGHLIPPITLKTDHNGLFETKPLPPSNIQIQATETSCETAHIICEIDGGLRLAEIHPIRLRPEFPVAIHVRDEAGNSLPGASIHFYGGEFEADDNGQWRVPHLGPNYLAQFRVFKSGYRSHSGGYRGDREIFITLAPAHYLLGTVKDAETQQPIRLSEAILCHYTLDDNGDPVPRGCRNPEFDQPEPGAFRIEHFGAHGYHLLLKAPGYEDWEKYLDPLDSDRDWDLGEIRMKRSDLESPETDDGPSIRQFIEGTVQDHNGAIADATATLWAPGRPIRDRVNAPVFYGRVVPPRPYAYAITITDSTGRFRLSVPYQGPWNVRVDQAGTTPIIVNNVEVSRGETTSLSIDLVEGGGIEGSVKNIAIFPLGTLWAIAFDGRGILEVAHVRPDGRFRFDRLPAGRYGLKVGHPGFRDREISRGWYKEKSAWTEPCDPWVRAITVEVQPGAVSTIDLDANWD